MRRLLPLTILLLAASCGGPDSYEAQNAIGTEASAPSEAMGRSADGRAGPDVAPTAAPGVAFNYRYAFQLPSGRIAAVQEQHSRTCEQLGISRCRITGMRYRVVSERDVQAMLAFKLEPGLARRFGQAGIEAVTRAEGMLVDAEISGTDVGSTIRAAGRNVADLTEELNRIEQRLARGGLPAAERERLEYEAQQLRQQIRANQATRQEQQESLATTPMVFEYGSGDFVPGYGARPSFRRAAERALDNFVEGVAILFVILVTLLPWALAAALAWAIVRFVRRRYFTPRAEAEAPPVS